ncbi:hypothetical protein Nepgr_019792 [Nepenthes gracilis]|uniref:F-box domain-containing protein n=1 Tax=Nepenthes gracilis TaxID=150966 RepID=A0AAD3SVX8_NEPGR|nr:hypothetical protein Nepgr_019792 [Nepenthes gracilis]
MQFTASAGIIAGNETFLTEILLRLPAKSLLKFKCVCKHWNSLISSPYFVRQHSRRVQPISAMIFYRWSKSGFEFSRFNSGGYAFNTPFTFLPLADDLIGVRILQSCNGLLLCSGYRRIEAFRIYFVYNPTTGKSVTIPLPSNCTKATILGMNLAFNPVKSPCYYIICISNSTVSPHYSQIKIYDSNTRNWKLCVDEFTAPFDMVFGDGVYWNRAIHWISPTGASLRFNIVEERVADMPMIPDGGHGWGKRRFRLFQESSGHLHLIEAYGACTTQFQVLEMEGDYSKWFAKYSVDLSGITTAYPEVIRSYLDSCDENHFLFQVMCLRREEKEEESSLVISIPGKFIAYSFADKQFREITDLRETYVDRNLKLSSQFEWLDVYPYLETLAGV